ncbi:MAG TPA: hypothetical protein VM619_16775 [Luteimonas sp.]|nr:hypothetical protein [Luteimonas sp.]
MQHLSKLAKAASLICGVGLALLGLTWIGITVSGALQTSHVAGYVAGAGFLIAAAPLLAFPFHLRLAKISALLALFLFAFAMVWLAFRPGQPLDRPVLAQAGAIALVVLLVARVGLAWYRRRAGLAA